MEDILKSAIEHSDLLSKRQKEVLSVIYSNSFPLSVNEIKMQLGLNTENVYDALRSLLNRNFVSRTKQRSFFYHANESRKKELIERFKQEI